LKPFGLRFQLPTSLFELRRDKTTQQVGIADLTASTVSDVIPHRRLYRNAIFLVAAATSTIAQLQY